MRGVSASGGEDGEGRRIGVVPLQQPVVTGGEKSRRCGDSDRTATTRLLVASKPTVLRAALEASEKESIQLALWRGGWAAGKATPGQCTWRRKRIGVALRRNLRLLR